MPRKSNSRMQASVTTVCLFLALAFIGASCGQSTNAPANQAGPPASQPSQPASSNQARPTQTAQSDCAPMETSGGPAIESLNVNQAVMVTVELNYGGKNPTIAEALRDIQRCYQPADGIGRTFAILDAYGEPTPDGKLLHMSMHVSSEKPGAAMLIFKRTGEVLWRSRINPTTEAPKQKNLSILIDQGGGRSITVDGSNNPPTVLEANVKEMGVPVKNVWADGTEREVTFIYSACGCPVKVMVRRAGDKTVRVSDRPVMFPDDPQAVQIISKLMSWQ